MFMLVVRRIRREARPGGTRPHEASARRGECVNAKRAWGLMKRVGADC